MKRLILVPVIVGIFMLVGWLVLPIGEALACSVCFTSVKGESSLIAYYAITILLTVLAFVFMGGIYYIVRRNGGAGQG